MVTQRFREEDKEREQKEKEMEKVRPTRLQRPTLAAARPGCMRIPRRWRPPMGDASKYKGAFLF